MRKILLFYFLSVWLTVSKSLQPIRDEERWQNKCVKPCCRIHGSLTGEFKPA